MGKKVMFVFLVLILVLSLCLSIALPVMADPGAKPVAWVNCGGTPASDKSFGEFSSYGISVKLLSDGTTVGHIVAHLFDYGEDLWSIGFDQSQTNFYEADGAKIAEFVAWVVEKPDGQPFMVKYKLMDYGEPAKGNDKYMIWVWVEIPGLPGFWWPMYGSGDPIPFPGGNIQVHLRD